MQYNAVDVAEIYKSFGKASVTDEIDITFEKSYKSDKNHLYHTFVYDEN